jgi:hypothetical protein
MSISDERTEAAVEYLRDTAERYGKARGHQAFCEKAVSRVKALEMIGKPGSLGDREAAAYSSMPYLKALEELENAVAEAETIRAKRDAAELTIEVWRTQTSAKKAGIR